MLDKKLELKDGQTIAVVGEDVDLELSAQRVVVDQADAVLVFTANETQLLKHLALLQSTARNEKLTWIAYPKAKKLDTDINRDIIRQIANENELDPVRQIAIDETWSALRLKLYAS
jgi:uncharacterized protein VirK/YbjX